MTAVELYSSSIIIDMLSVYMVCSTTIRFFVLIRAGRRVLLRRRGSIMSSITMMYTYTRNVYCRQRVI
jgi:hypothetical protein